MSYNRKVIDNKKGRNPVARHDFNKGGFHGKSKKAERKASNQNLIRDIDENGQLLTEEDYLYDLMYC